MEMAYNDAFDIACVGHLAIKPLKIILVGKNSEAKIYTVVDMKKYWRSNFNVKIVDFEKRTEDLLLELK
jgi:hypothetical protein